MYLISACLVGLNTTYLQKNNIHPLFQWMLETGSCIPFCPEQLGGLSTPRSASEILGGDGAGVLKSSKHNRFQNPIRIDNTTSHNKGARVINTEGKDITEHFIQGAYEALKIAQMVKPEMIILKERSPSCGVNFIYDGSFSKNIITGSGVTTALLQYYGFKTISDEDFINTKEQVPD